MTLLCTVSYQLHGPHYPEQDRGLEALSNALRRQKKMGQQIGEEVEYQTGEVSFS